VSEPAVSEHNLMQIAYMSGPNSMSVFMLCFFSFLTGCGSCSAFQAAIKTAALNWPHHRGTATAFPLAAFGLSAFFFTSLSSILFPHSTSSYLLLLVIGSFCMVFFPVFFIYVPHTEAYQSLANDENDPPRRNSALMHRPSTWRAKVKHGIVSPKQGQ
jgi:MFS family permease